jgi:hypothetical protein
MDRFNRFDAIGILFGLLLYYLWFLVIFLFQNIFLAKKEVIHGAVVYTVPHNELISWLSDGLLLFYTILGHYIVTKKEADVKILRNFILGFIAWSIVLAILNLAGFSISSFLQYSLELSPSISILLSVLVGYTVMIAICFILLFRRSRNNNDE